MNPETCPHCYGEGKEIVPYEVKPMWYFDFAQDCHVCQGFGYIIIDDYPNEFIQPFWESDELPF